MFFIKKLVSRFLFPVPLCAELLVAGLILLLFSKRQKLGKALLIAGVVVFLAFGFPWVPSNALKPLERKYHAVRDPITLLHGLNSTGVYIAVMGQSVSSDTSLPANARFNPEFISRLLEAGRLHRRLLGSKLLVSVSGKTIEEDAKRRVLAEFYELMGISSNNITVFGDALDSESEIKYFKTQAGTNLVFLVSTASHLPRAMLLAQRNALNAIPAPSGYLLDASVDTKSRFDPSSLFPWAGNITLAERAVYEYLGLLFEKLRN